MFDNNNPVAISEANHRWDRARRRLWRQRFVRWLKRQPDDELLSFEQVQKELRLIQGISRGIQNIPLDRIRGSVGRYKDFSSSFLPQNTELRERWQRVDAYSIHDGISPISAYQVGEAYFVLDGNHRVSVAREQGLETIEAHVLEYKGLASLSAQANFDEVLLKGELAKFLQETNIAKLRPQHEIEFTVPGRFRQVKYMIRSYADFLREHTDSNISDSDALVSWYDQVFDPLIKQIKKSNVMKDFPRHTPADLFIWMWRYQKPLEHIVPAQRFSWLERLTKWLRRHISRHDIGRA